jgi:transposase
MSPKLNSGIAVIGIDIGKNSFHVVGLDRRGTIVLRQKWSRGQVAKPARHHATCLIHGAASAGLERDLEKIRCGTEFVLLAAVPPLSKKVCELDGVFTKSR